MITSFLRALCAIAIGALLICTPDTTVLWITIAIGAVFILAGAISCVAYLVNRHSEGRRPLFPVVGIGSILLGFALALMPTTFVSFLMYFLGALLIIGALCQIASLIRATRALSVPWGFYVCPAIVLLAGIVVILKPMESASLPLIIIGWCMAVYGIAECINAIKVGRAMRAIRQAAEAEQQTSNTELLTDNTQTDVQEADAVEITSDEK